MATIKEIAENRNCRKRRISEWSSAVANSQSGWSAKERTNGSL